MKDTLRRFLFENLAIRGELVHLDATWQAVLERHDYPQPLQNLLGQLMSAVVLLMATLKFKGKLIAQVQGKGPVSLLVVEGTSDKTLRAMASWKDELEKDQLAGENLPGLFGDGRLVITLEPEQGERYQGIVALTGNTLADTLTDYLLRSEQLDTDLWLAADDKQAAGLLIQKLPETKHTKSSSTILGIADVETDIDAWNRIQQLSSTITDEELLELYADEIIHRLYHEEDVRIFEAEVVSFRCSCSRERVANMLRSLGVDEIHATLSEQKTIEVACEFCLQKYVFDAVDAEQIFASDVPHLTPTTEH